MSLRLTKVFNKQAVEPNDIWPVVIQCSSWGKVDRKQRQLDVNVMLVKKTCTSSKTAKTTGVNEVAAAVTARPTPSQQRQLGRQLGTFKLLPISLGSRTRSDKPQVCCRQCRKEVRRTLLEKEKKFVRTKKTLLRFWAVVDLGRRCPWVGWAGGHDGLTIRVETCPTPCIP